MLCDDPVANFAQAREKAWYYATRWLIEEFRKALKTGLGAERLQLRTAHRLFAAVALLSVVALALVNLCERSRQQPDAPAKQAGLPAQPLQVLRKLGRQPVRTVREVFMGIAALGGYLGRRGDGPPGWQSLWRGLGYLRQLVAGVDLAAGSLPEGLLVADG